MRTFGVEFGNEAIELFLLLKDIHCRRTSGFLSQGQMHARLPAVLLGWPDLMRPVRIPSRSHQTDNLERLESPFGLAKGSPLSDRIACERRGSANNSPNASMTGPSRMQIRPNECSPTPAGHARSRRRPFRIHGPFGKRSR